LIIELEERVHVKVAGSAHAIVDPELGPPPGRGGSAIAVPHGGVAIELEVDRGGAIGRQAELAVGQAAAGFSVEVNRGDLAGEVEGAHPVVPPALRVIVLHIRKVKVRADIPERGSDGS
jgi:hypothetical protein